VCGLGGTRPYDEHAKLATRRALRCQSRGTARCDTTSIATEYVRKGRSPREEVQQRKPERRDNSAGPTSLSAQN
jgi:hypothetical protein